MVTSGDLSQEYHPKVAILTFRANVSPKSHQAVQPPSTTTFVPVT
jgi:hypothetical protein